MRNVSLVEENARRGKQLTEFELIDTGLFDNDRYFDVFVEYAKATPEDVLMTITAHNRGPEEARLHLLPQLWFRNTWAWQGTKARPSLAASGNGALHVQHDVLGEYWFYADGKPELLFCENETNVRRLYGMTAAPGQIG